MKKAEIVPTAISEPNTIPRIAPTLATGTERAAFGKDCVSVAVPVADVDVATAVVGKVGEPRVFTKLVSARSAFCM